MYLNRHGAHWLTSFEMVPWCLPYTVKACSVSSAGVQSVGSQPRTHREEGSKSNAKFFTLHSITSLAGRTMSITAGQLNTPSIKTLLICCNPRNYLPIDTTVVGRQTFSDSTYTAYRSSVQEEQAPVINPTRVAWRSNIHINRKRSWKTWITLQL